MICINILGGFKCVCVLGWIGSVCEIGRVLLMLIDICILVVWVGWLFFIVFGK